MTITRIVRSSAATAIFLGVITLANSSFAQPASDAASQAAQHFDKGTKLYKESRWAEAEAEFQKAWDARRSFDVAANLGDCELEIGQHREAAEHLAFAMREFPLTGKPALRERLAERFAQARAHVGALKIRVNVHGAEIAIDGRSIGMAPLTDEVFVDPGRHAIEARLGDYETGRAGVDVARGGSREVSLDLVKKAQPGGGPNKVIVISGGVLTGVGLIAGVALAVAAGGKGSDADSKLAALKPTPGADVCAPRASTCAAIDSDRASRDKLSNASMGVFIGAGAIGAATLGYTLVALRGRPSPSALRVLPAVGAGQAGVIMMGAW